MKSPAFLLVALLAGPAAAWVPPDKPDPQQILNEARADREARRFEDALSKHVWFHENAVRIDPSLSGVRRTSAIADWRLLSFRYGPARQKMRALRDAAGEDVRRNVPDARQAFLDFAVLNEALEEESSTRDLFLWLDQHRPALAREAYPRAQPLLVRAGDYAICGKYLDPTAALEHLTTSYRSGLRFARRSVGGDIDVAELQFTSEATLIAALLARNNRREEAQKFSTAALKVVDTPAFRSAMNDSLGGKIPDLGPSESLRALTRALERASAYLGL